MPNELTYILGAGASYQSIPIVKSFPHRFDLFAYYLSIICQNADPQSEEYRSFKEAHLRATKISEAFKTHQSFDTYFKKLFHTKEFEKISEAKKILNLYFIWEHLSKVESEPEIKAETIFWKQSIIDKRYDALIAGLLKPLPGKSEPYCPINFITWNYDMNLFISLKNYFSPNESFGDFLVRIDKGNNLWQIDDKISVINMNGYFYSSIISFLPDINTLQSNKIEPDQIFQKKITSDYFSPSVIDNDAELIKFAWESNSISNSKDLGFVNYAKEKISESENIVIIGYTFPLYNRLVDLEYLSQDVIANKDVIVQDPNAKTISQNLYDYYRIKENKKLKAIVDCDSFYIPSTVFGITEYKNLGKYTWVSI